MQRLTGSGYPPIREWSFQLQAKLLDQITKLDVVAVHELRQLLRAARFRLEAAQLECLPELGIGGDLHDVGVELLDDCGRSAARHQHGKPEADVDAGQSRLGE